MIYELINPSDKVTLEAESLGVAAFCALYLSSHYGVNNADDPEDKFFEFFGGVHEFQKRFGSAEAFFDSNKTAIADCFDSFAYCSPEERRTFKRALELIDDQEKRETLKREHEDANRTSMSAIVKCAWNTAKALRAAAENRGGNAENVASRTAR